MKTKTSIIALIMAGTIGGAMITGGGITHFDFPDGGRWLTKTQYNDLRNELSGKYLLKQDFTIQEYQLFVAVMDKEAKKGKFKDVKNVNKNNLIGKIIKRSVQ